VSYEDQVLTALAESLSEIEGLQESPYVLSHPTPPCAEVIGGQVDYDQTFGRGHDDWNATIRVTVGDVSDVGAQKLLRQFRDPAGAVSIKRAIEADRSLGGLVQGLRVTGVSPMRQFRRPDGSTQLGCDFECAWLGYGQESG
jgi:hypothetical protein